MAKGGNVDFEQLERLVAIDEEGTLSRAAERLAISQPALSRSVRRLEAEVDHELFDRTANRMALNRAGRLAVDFAHEVLRGKRRLLDELDVLAERDRIVRVGSVAPAPLWQLTARILERDPGAIIDPSFMSEDALERALMNRDLCYGIALRPLALPGMRSEPLMEERLSAYVPVGHELAGRASVRWADLDGETFVVVSAIGFWWDVCRRHMPAARLVRQNDNNVYDQMVATTDVLTFCTDYTGELRRVPSRVAVPIDDEDACARFWLTEPEG